MNTFTMRHHSDKLGDPSYLFFSYSVKKMYFLRKFCFLSKKLLVPGSGSSDTWPIVSVIVSVLLVAILLSEALLLTLAHRRGGLVLLGKIVEDSH